MMLLAHHAAIASGIAPVDVDSLSARWSSSAASRSAISLDRLKPLLPGPYFTGCPAKASASLRALSGAVCMGRLLFRSKA
jgi:hypothetical protein